MTLTVTQTGAEWTTDEYKNLIVIPNVSKKDYNYKIAGNTTDTLTVQGPINLTKVVAGNTFAIVYGKLIKDSIPTPNSGNKPAKFFRDNGVNSFADGNTTV
ncbi:MAG: hypothetical protein HZA14_01295 [Nitrospirae bacterium]|nr:hypothetical protein [Nitrospirota bacterium]